MGTSLPVIRYETAMKITRNLSTIQPVTFVYSTKETARHEASSLSAFQSTRETSLPLLKFETAMKITKNLTELNNQSL